MTVAKPSSNRSHHRGGRQLMGANATTCYTPIQPSPRRSIAMLLTFLTLALAITAVGLPLAGQAHADGVFNICPSGHDGVMSGTPTTCAFADNVHDAWLSQRGNPVIAYSPVTGQFYSMTCVPGQATVSGIHVDGWICLGGNNAQVVLW